MRDGGEGGGVSRQVISPFDEKMIINGIVTRADSFESNNGSYN